MKICDKLLVTLCVAQHGAAFVLPSHKTDPAVGALHSTAVNGDRVGTRTRTYQDVLNEPWHSSSTGGQLWHSRNHGGQLARARSGSHVHSVYDVWDTMRPMTIQGDGGLRTWSLDHVERAQVLLSSEGREFDANIEVWNGPDHVPQKMRVYSEDGYMRPFSAIIATPGGYSNTISIRNKASMTFPLKAVAGADNPYSGLGALTDGFPRRTYHSRTIQGGSVVTFPCDPYAERMQLYIETDGRPLQARVELMEGPNSNKQVVEVESDDGLLRPFMGVFETPGAGNVVRIVNTGSTAFPMYASVTPVGYGRGYDRGYDRDYDRDYSYYGARRHGNSYGYLGGSGGGYYNNRPCNSWYDRDYYNSGRYYGYGGSNEQRWSESRRGNGYGAYGDSYWSNNGYGAYGRW